MNAVERAALKALGEWYEADEAARVKDGEVVRRVAGPGGLTPDDVRELVRLKSVESGRRAALRAAASALKGEQKS